MPIGRPDECIASGNEIAGVPMMLCGTVNEQVAAYTFSIRFSIVTSVRARFQVPHGSATRGVVGDSHRSLAAKYCPSRRRSVLSVAMAFRNCAGFIRRAYW